MTNLTITEKYFLCAVGREGKIRGIDNERVAALLASLIIEMESQGYLTVDGNNILISDLTPPENSYCYSFYSFLKKQATSDPVKAYQGIMEPISFKDTFVAYSSPWSGFRLNQLTTDIGTGLANRNMMVKAKLGLFNGRTYFIPAKQVIPSLTQQLSLTLSYEVPLDLDDCFLWELLFYGECLPKDLAGTFAKDVKEKIKALIDRGFDPALIHRHDIVFSLVKIAKKGLLLE